LNAPRLWGPGNLVQHSTYSTLSPLSAFIRQYMPLEPVNGVNPGSLTQAQAKNLAQYILSHNHP
jgi:thiosulfate dehydrogenase